MIKIQIVKPQVLTTVQTALVYFVVHINTHDDTL